MILLFTKLNSSISQCDEHDLTEVQRKNCKVYRSIHHNEVYVLKSSFKSFIVIEFIKV